MQKLRRKTLSKLLLSRIGCFAGVLLSAAVVLPLSDLQTAPGLGQAQRKIVTAKGEKADTSLPHPLAYWTREPLRLDADGDLLIGRPAGDDKPITAGDYRVEQQVTPIGKVGGDSILQVVTTIHAGPRILAAHLATDQPAQWKILLVESGATGRYREIYRLQAEGGGYEPFQPAAIYGSGADAVLGTYDPDSGNGGGCADGYWWFDAAGAHAVDFSPLNRSILQAIPKNGSYIANCYALHPGESLLKSRVQKTDAECHACGGLGEVEAKYRIERAIATAVSVHFEPGEQ